MGRRSILLVAALVVAALGTTMVFLYVNGVNNRADVKQNPVRVQVAKNLIQAGTSVQDAINAGDFDTKTISNADAIAGAIGDLTPIKGLAANTTIHPGDQITREKFGDPGDTSTLDIPTGNIAIAVTLDDPAQVAGFVDAGSTVAIFYTAPAAKGGSDQTRLLISQVKVLAIGNKTAVPLATTSGTEADPVSKTILTLALDQANYQRVLFASSHGHLNLGLLGKGSSPSPTVPPTTQTNLFN